MNENHLDTIEALSDRNPFGFYSDFNPEKILDTVSKDISIETELITPSDVLSYEFEQASSEEIQPNLMSIKSRLTWEGKEYGQVGYVNEKLPNGIVLMSHLRLIDTGNNAYGLKSNDDHIVVRDDPNEQSVRIFSNDSFSEVRFAARIPNPSSWSNLTKALHELGHLTRLKNESIEQLRYYNTALGRFDAFIANYNSHDANKAFSKDDFSRGEMIEILRQEHEANNLGIVSLNFMNQKLSLPQDLNLEMHKRLIRNYRTYCAWVPIVVANFD